MDAADPEGIRGLWLVPLDRQWSPRKIPNGDGGRQPKFGRDGDIFFRRPEEGASNFVYRIRQDGSELRKALAHPIPLLFAVSRDERWVVGWSYLPANAGMALQAFPLDGGHPLTITAHAVFKWSPSGNTVSVSGGPIVDTRSYIIPLTPGEALPRIPAEGFRSEEEIAKLPGARRIDALSVPGPSSDVYAFYRGTTQRNLYRIPVQ
jgi:hypothetical protein